MQIPDPNLYHENANGSNSAHPSQFPMALEGCEPEGRACKTRRQIQSSNGTASERAWASGRQDIGAPASRGRRVPRHRLGLLPSCPPCLPRALSRRRFLSRYGPDLAETVCHRPDLLGSACQPTSLAPADPAPLPPKKHRARTLSPQHDVRVCVSMGTMSYIFKYH